MKNKLRIRKNGLHLL